MGKSSSVWEHFNVVEGGVNCTISGCLQPFIKRAGKDTTSLWSHLKNRHKTIYDGLEIQKQPSKRPSQAIVDTSDNSQVKKRRTYEAESAVMNMLARRNVSFTLVDDPLFQRMMSKTFGNVGLHGSRYFARVVLLRVADDVMKKLRFEIGDRFFAITTDGWSALRKPNPPFYR